ncbi:MAG: tetratricopeptide repeat-containing sensor histidine kinase [Marinifilaceae bacterium]|jgi:signal transduction histidine kinase/lipopolysaccharide biosynthesis regulator YciM|nr:tetratricopeptide repeat-containing sensor histidine kinase [Marinifilaceae bacterium]
MRKIIFILIYIVYINSYINTNQAFGIENDIVDKYKIDSILNKLEKDNNIKAEILINKLDSIYKITDKKDLFHSKIRCLGLIASTKSFLNQNKDAILIYDSLLNLVDSSSFKLQYYKYLGRRANTYRKIGEYEKAEKDICKSVKYFELKNQIFELALSRNCLALILTDKKEYQKAIELHKKALDTYSKDTVLTDLQYLTNNYIANIYSKKDENEISLKYHYKNIDILKNHPDSIKLAKSFHNIGTVYYNLKNYDKAEKYLIRSLKLKNKIKNLESRLNTLNNLASVYRYNKKYNKALTKYYSALNIAKQSNNYAYQKSIYKSLIITYHSLEQSGKMLEFLDKYDNISKKIINDKKITEIIEQEEKYELEKKAMEKSIRSKENILKDYKRNYIIISLTAFFIILIFISLYYLKTKKNKRLLSLHKKKLNNNKEILNIKDKELKDLNHSKNKLLQIISHDLRSPLASIYNISKMINLFISQNRISALHSTNKDLNNNITNVILLTDNLLSWSLSQTGKIKYKPSEINLLKTVNLNFAPYKNIAEKKLIKYNIEIDQELCVLADKHMLDTIIRNLINNSIKFTEQGGNIEIGANIESEELISVWIEDTGIGMSEDLINNIINQSYLDTEEKTNKENGTGLGLLLCKDFINRNNASFSIKSEIGKGTKISLLLHQKAN